MCSGSLSERPGGALSVLPLLAAEPAFPTAAEGVGDTAPGAAARPAPLSPARRAFVLLDLEVFPSFPTLLLPSFLWLWTGQTQKHGQWLISF